MKLTIDLYSHINKYIQAGFSDSLSMLSRVNATAESTQLPLQAQLVSATLLSWHVEQSVSWREILASIMC